MASTAIARSSMSRWRGAVSTGKRNNPRIDPPPVKAGMVGRFAASRKAGLWTTPTAKGAMPPTSSAQDRALARRA